MKAKFFICLICLASLFFLNPITVLGDTRRVPGQYPTLQAAINGANDGDVVLVSDGTYAGPGNVEIDLMGKAITLRSENGPEKCIIAGRGTLVQGVLRHNFRIIPVPI